MRRDRVEQFRAGVGLQAVGSFLHQAQAEVNVSQQASFLGLREPGAVLRFPGPADVVQERSCQE